MLDMNQLNFVCKRFNEDFLMIFFESKQTLPSQNIPHATLASPVERVNDRKITHTVNANA